MADGVTIGRAAAFAGITVKTVRHYHRLGLLAEPRRDDSGYRRYGPSELLRLVQIRTLAGAGVPLAEVGPLLEAGPERFAAALADVRRRLTDRIEELTARRDTLHRLTEGDRALLPDRALALLDRMAGLGFTAEQVAISREGLVLAKALVPEGFDDYLAAVENAAGDARFIALNRRCWEARGWEPDDPRIEPLAATVVDHYLANPELLKIATSFQVGSESGVRYGLISHYGEDDAPAWARLNALIESGFREAGVPIPR